MGNFMATRTPIRMSSGGRRASSGKLSRSGSVSKLGFIVEEEYAPSVAASEASFLSEEDWQQTAAAAQVGMETSVRPDSLVPRLSFSRIETEESGGH